MAVPCITAMMCVTHGEGGAVRDLRLGLNRHFAIIGVPVGAMHHALPWQGVPHPTHTHVSGEGREEVVSDNEQLRVIVRPCGGAGPCPRHLHHSCVVRRRVFVFPVGDRHRGGRLGSARNSSSGRVGRSSPAMRTWVSGVRPYQ